MDCELGVGADPEAVHRDPVQPVPRRGGRDILAFGRQQRPAQSGGYLRQRGDVRLPPQPVSPAKAKEDKDDGDDGQHRESGKNLVHQIVAAAPAAAASDG